MTFLALKLFVLYKTFPILDDHYNSNFRWVDVKGRCNYFVDASYHHQRGPPQINLRAGTLSCNTPQQPTIQLDHRPVVQAILYHPIKTVIYFSHQEMPETEVFRSASPAESLSSTGSGNGPKVTPRRKQTPAPAPVSPVPPLSPATGAQRTDYFQVSYHFVSPMLCISTSEQVLRTPFADRNHLFFVFDTKTTISVNFR